jgi:site-specific recombinase XerD
MRERELSRFGNWLKRRRPRVRLEDVDSALVVGYISARAAFRARATVAGVVSDLRCMGEFLVREGVWLSSPLRWMRGPKLDPRQKLPKRLGSTQLDRIWAAARTRPQRYARHQALCVLAILYGTGLRRGELERLEVGHWDGQSGVLEIDGRKTGQMRHVAVGAGVWRCIEAYLPHRHNLLENTGRLDEQALLVSRTGARLSGNAISRLVHQLGEGAGVEGVTLHQFRHSCASHLLEAGATLPQVQKVLGHAAIESTVRYVAVSDPARARAIGLHPINGFVTEPQDRKAS